MRHPAKTIAALTAALALTLSTLPITACSQRSVQTTPTNTSKAQVAETGAAAMTSDATVESTIAYQPEFNTEEYRALTEGGFISPSANPLSTLSADVDTASYCNVRRMLTSGYGADEVPAGAVRIEEMLNYFDYSYPAPNNGDDFAIKATMGDCPWNADTKLLTLGFCAAPYDPASSAGTNLVFLIDISGSMDDPEKLPLLQQAFEVLLDGLGPDDRVSIVTYASGEHLVLDGAPASERLRILRAIKSLEAHGSTNGQAGLSLAYDVAQAHYIDGGVNRIVMASDGDLNVGITSESDLHDFVAAKRNTGIYLSVLGFGSGNYKDTKMETLADCGNGAYHYIDSIGEARRVLSENLTANVTPFADDVKVQVEFNPALVKAYRLIGYENRELADEDFKNDAKDAGEVGPGMQFTVAYEVALADSALEIAAPELRYGSQTGSFDTDEFACAALRYRAFADGAVHEQQLAMSAASVNAADDDWRFAASVIEFGMLLRGSEHAGNATLDGVAARLSQMQLDDERAEFASLVELARDPIYVLEDATRMPSGA